MSVTIPRSVIIAEARAWLGTPYEHHQHTRGAGTDCGGLIGGIAVAVGSVPPNWWNTEFAPHAGYSRQPSGGRLLAIMRGFMTEIDPAAAVAGDVVLMRFSQEPQHVGILVPYALGGLALVHALASEHRVVEHRFADVWRARVTHAFVFPGVTA